MTHKNQILYSMPFLNNFLISCESCGASVRSIVSVTAKICHFNQDAVMAKISSVSQKRPKEPKMAVSAENGSVP